MKVVHCPVYGPFTSIQKIQKKQIRILQLHSWPPFYNLLVYHKPYWSVTESHDIIYWPLIDFNQNLNGQLPNCMTLYNDHWMTSITTWMALKWHSWSPLLITEWFSWHHHLTFNLLNVCLVSVGQVQGLNTWRATNEQVRNRTYTNIKNESKL